MFVAQNRFRIASAHAPAFEKVWRERESRLASQPGFLRFQFLKAVRSGGPRAEAPVESVEFVSSSQWLDEASFLAWMTGDNSRAVHAASSVPREAYLGPPEFRGYDVLLDEVPGGRSDYRSAHLDLVVEGRFAIESPEQARIRERSLAAGLPAIQIAPFEGRLIEILLRAISARRGVEIGTLGGYSTSWLARALPEDGRVLSFELQPERAELARRHLDEAGFGAKVEIRAGRALESLASLEKGGAWDSLDFVFIDADKASSGDYVEWALARLRPGGFCLVDNAYIWGGMNYWGRESASIPFPPRGRPDHFGTNEFRGMSAAWDRLAFHPEMASIILPTGEGLAVGLKR